MTLPHLDRLAKLAGVAAGVLLLAAGGYFGLLQLQGNFHTVIAGELYRSAQPSPQSIARYYALYHFNTIINLQGEHADRTWYASEAAEAKRLNISLVDFPMSAVKQLPQVRAAMLVEILKNARKPILIHCKDANDQGSSSINTTSGCQEMSDRYGPST